MTKKSGGDLQRKEDESEISEREFDTLWPSTNGRRIEKTRVEFSSVEESQSFTPPEFLGRDVTNNKMYKNQQLAVYGIPPTD